MREFPLDCFFSLGGLAKVDLVGREDEEEDDLSDFDPVSDLVFDSSEKEAVDCFSSSSLGPK
jgi:hypothetical protein